MQSPTRLLDADHDETLFTVVHQIDAKRKLRRPEHVASTIRMWPPWVFELDIGNIALSIQRYAHGAA